MYGVCQVRRSAFRILLGLLLAGWSVQAEPELAGTIVVAPFADVSAKVSNFGLAIGNPIVPTLLIVSLQQSVVSTYGNFRTDAPLCLASYAGAKGRTDEAVIFPSVDRIARMALNNPGSVREGPDALHLVPSEKRAHDRHAVFTPDGKFVAFASTQELARRALADCRPGELKELPLARVSLGAGGVARICAAGRAAGVTNMLGVLQKFRRLEASLDFTDRGLVLGFGGSCAGPASAGFKGRLEQELRGAVMGLLGGEVNVVPAVRASLTPDGGVRGEVSISTDQLKALGTNFNAFVAAQMSGAMSNDGKGKNGKNGGRPKGAAKGKEQKK